MAAPRMGEQQAPHALAEAPGRHKEHVHMTARATEKARRRLPGTGKPQFRRRGAGPAHLGLDFLHGSRREEVMAGLHTLSPQGQQRAVVGRFRGAHKRFGLPRPQYL